MEASELLKHALTLSERERAELASSLIDSLDPTVDADVELAWQEEITRRLEEIESGRVKSIPWEEVRRKGRLYLQWHMPIPDRAIRESACGSEFLAR
jgi:putative addiction module component (TIGR02574 family)